MDAPIMTLDDLVEDIPDGAKLALAPEYNGCGCALAAVRALINRAPEDLHLIGLPALGLQADLLIGAGAVTAVECAAVTLGEEGLAPRFTAAVKAGTLSTLDATCPAIHAGLQASEKGVPFMPLRGILGSDLLAHRDDWQVGQNPFDENDDPIVLIAALKPDVALFHTQLADKEGNVWIGVHKELMTLAHASAKTLVTYEKLYDGDLLADEKMAAGTIPSIYVSGLAEAEKGAWPVALPDHYDRDVDHIRAYVELAANEDGFRQYLMDHVYTRIAAE
ncbi:MAG: CoA synthetase [Rhodospirillaceae bacterium]|nr:CoA synthetase [Rhodospirillaceae bacterium]HAA91935.1 CoA synthetase [Rhodospirillaceae bacterium]